jgi:hypothetical protein
MSTVQDLFSIGWNDKKTVFMTMGPNAHLTILYRSDEPARKASEFSRQIFQFV